MKSGQRAAFLAGILAFFLAPASPAPASPPSVESVFPACGRRGDKVVVKLSGARLDTVREIAFYKPGLSVESIGSDGQGSCRVTIAVSPDAPLGPVPMRARGDDGYSSLHLFHVVSLPVVALAENEASGKTPKALKGDCCVAGILAEGEVHRFAITLRKGERLVAEAVGIRAGAAFLDTHLELVSPSGKPLAVADDSPQSAQDAVLEAAAQEDGAHVLVLREANLGGSDNGFYMLHVGGFPRPMRVSPPGGRPGEKTAFQFNDIRGSRALESTLPASFSGTHNLYLSDSSGTSPTPNPVRVTNHAVYEESAGNLRAPEAPVAFHGLISAPGQTDTRPFTARKGQVLLVEAWARRLGSPLEPVMEITDSAGRQLSASDDDEGHDSRIRFEVPAEGAYSLKIRDQRGQGGPDHFYRVEVGPDAATLACFLPRPNRLSQERQTVLIPSGGRALVILGARRGDLGGEVALTASELPAGVKVISYPARAGEFRIPCLMEAAAGTKPRGALARLGVTHAGGQQGGFLQTVDLVAESADTLYQGVELDRLAVAVGNPSPVSVELDAPRAGLPVDGAITLRAKVTRSEGFTGAVELLIPLLPAWVEGPEIVKVPAGKTAAEFELTALPGAIPGEFPLAIEARALERGSARVCSRFVPLRVVPRLVESPPVNLVARQGGKAPVMLPMKPGLPYSGTARLLELPPRVTAAEAPLNGGAAAVPTEAVVAADGPVGEHRNIVCAISMAIGGEKVTQYVARGTTLRIEPPGSSAIGPDGRPLSRLEQLRAKSPDKPMP